MAAKHAEEVAVLVAHRVVCKLLLCAALGLGEVGFWTVRVDTASISTLAAREGRWVVAGANDTHHLAARGTADRSDF
jgi:broad specificity phosphatase PhoE